MCIPGFMENQLSFLPQLHLLTSLPLLGIYRAGQPAPGVTGNKHRLSPFSLKSQGFFREESESHLEIYSPNQSSILKVAQLFTHLWVSAFAFYNRSDIKISSLVVILISNYVKELFNVKYLYLFYFLFSLPPLVFLWRHSAHFELVLSLLQSLDIFFL